MKQLNYAITGQPEGNKTRQNEVGWADKSVKAVECYVNSLALQWLSETGLSNIHNHKR